MDNHMNQSISEELKKFVWFSLPANRYRRVEGLTASGDIYVAMQEDIDGLISQALTADRKELREKLKAMLLPIPNPYGKWVSVENVNKKIIGKILALLEEK